MTPLRRYEDYPPQEPFSPIGEIFHAKAQRLGAGIDGMSFAYGSSPHQEVALFRASKPDGRVLMFMHGGGWTNGYKEWMAFMAPPLNAAGVTFVSADYRLAPDHLWPAGRDDAAAAVAWIHSNIADHGGDPERIHVGGHSAGGHYAAWLAVHDDWQKRAGVPPNIVKGCLPVSGVYDFTPGNGMPQKPRFLGDAPRTEVAASPLHAIAGAPPPFLVAWGDDDFPQLIRQAHRMVAALESAGGAVTAIELAGCDHAEAAFICADRGGPWLPAALDFMK
jgi:acetyl esterase/lipase